MDFLISMLRTLFFSLDKVVFGLIDDVYGLLLQLTRTTIFDQDVIHEFSKRVYALVGIFMLFKVSVSIINYILNPDDFTDKEKGFGSIIKHVVLSLVLVVLVPYIFQEAYDLQSIILRENTIMNLVFGAPSAESPRAANSSYTESAGKKIQFTLLYAFAHPNYDDFANDASTYDLIDCKETYDTDENGQFKFRLKPVFEGNTDSTDSSSLSSFIYELRPSCWGVYNAENDSYEASGENGTLYQAFKGIDADVAYQNYAQGVAQQSFSLFFRKEVILAKLDDGRYLVDYKFGISTAVGVGTLYLFLLFCIDIAVRSIKLGFLQMIAPIPIISYCDPKSSKDGMFKKWMDMSVKTYLDLFIRLFALYFGIYIISLLGTFKDIETGETVDGLLVMVFMILGVLMFIKKLPDILKEVFNVKGDGKFQLNPLKKIEEEAIGGKQIAGASRKALGVAGGIGVGAVAAGAGLLTGQGIHGKAFASAIQGGWKGDKFGKNFANSYSAGRQRHRQLREMDADGVSRGDVFGENVRNTLNMRTKADRLKGVTEGLKAIQDDYKSYESTAAGVDSLAKDFDKRRKAAESSGDYAEAKRWNTAFDQRIKEIAQRGGYVSSDHREDAATIVNADGTYNLGSFTVTSSTDPNAALQNIATHMEGLASAMNKEGKSIEGYQEVSTNISGTTGDIKAVRNQALGSQQSVETNQANRTINNTSKYTNSGQKK